MIRVRDMFCSKLSETRSVMSDLIASDLTAFRYIRVISPSVMSDQVISPSESTLYQLIRFIGVRVPIAFAITVLAEALIECLDVQDVAPDLCVAVFMLLTSQLFWRYVLCSYSGPSA